MRSDAEVDASLIETPGNIHHKSYIADVNASERFKSF
jgi:hypothetical protein